jgi:hypothetical protein
MVKELSDGDKQGWSFFVCLRRRIVGLLTDKSCQIKLISSIQVI